MKGCSPSFVYLILHFQEESRVFIGTMDSGIADNLGRNHRPSPEELLVFQPPFNRQIKSPFLACGGPLPMYPLLEIKSFLPSPPMVEILGRCSSEVKFLRRHWLSRLLSDLEETFSSPSRAYRAPEVPSPQVACLQLTNPDCAAAIPIGP